ncbi:hypothetical protein DO97_08795 [Neosynechococcus sphagnicola sy1]|uniref:Response regulatory domain-containing protein n=1 Tax=Neosynechococcus sphagnicola sy1 TaxID=1497020 RepID=A0A098TJP8_9CYAN|nr:response regulator transcription factor [Neosynechococcus sphagnicola]KGF72456.1 hypothetical protein DO97_08795 [Neosynechococcus sphagnicola sy1]
MGKILVIEDEDAIRSNILEMLEDEGMEAVGAANGLLGVLWAQNHVPDLVICDIMMPELDGYGVLTALKSNPTTELVSFIFLTAKAEKSDTRYGMNLGADDYLTKPFTKKELLSAIHTQLKKHAAVTTRVNMERYRVEAIEQRLQELNLVANAEGDVLRDFFEQLTNPVTRCKLAIYMLENDATGDGRRPTLDHRSDLYLDILQTEFTQNPELFQQCIKSPQLLSLSTLKLLRQHGLIPS